MLYELAFTATRSVSGQSCEVKQRRAWLIAGWVTQALEQGRLGSCAHAGYHQYYIDMVYSYYDCHVDLFSSLNPVICYYLLITLSAVIVRCNLTARNPAREGRRLSLVFASSEYRTQIDDVYAEVST